MPKTNHRRKNRPPVDRRHEHAAYKNGYARADDEERLDRVGRTGFLDKSLHEWGGSAPLSDRMIGAGIGNDFHYGHRGMARAVAGAKKFVRSRVRFHENAATRRAAQEAMKDREE